MARETALMSAALEVAVVALSRQQQRLPVRLPAEKLRADKPNLF